MSAPRTELLRLTTNPGIEDVCARDIHRVLAADGYRMGPAIRRPYDLAGQLIVHVHADPGPAPDAAPRRDSFTAWLLETLSGSRSLYHVISHRAAFELSPGASMEELMELLRSVPVPDLEDAASFRVSCNRSGDHPFRSMEVTREYGAWLVSSYGTTVDLTGYEIEVRVDIIGAIVLLGIQRTREALDKRYRWLFRPRVTLRTVVAYGMLELADWETEPRALLDPFCGSGTILFEAASLFSHARIAGSDNRGDTVEGAMANARAAGLAERIQLRVADARDLADHYAPESFDGIVTNPPYGVRLHRNVDFRVLYRKFLSGAATLLVPGGRLVMLVGKRRAAFNRALRDVGAFRIGMSA